MGSGSGTNNSRPLSADERGDIYDSATARLSQYIPQQGYSAPTYTDPGEAKTMSGGDYDRLEQSILQSRYAPLDRQLDLERKRTDQSLSDRGLWSSGIAEGAQQDVTERFLPAYTQAGGEAANQRYGMQATEQAMLNQFMLNKAQGKTSFDMENALRDDSSRWRPADYLAGIWNGTGGSISSGENSNWSI